MLSSRLSIKLILPVSSTAIGRLLENDPEVKLFSPFFRVIRQNLTGFANPNDIRFCHNDLCYGHFLKGKTIIFLDWELAGMNDFYSDLAAFIHFQQLDQAQTKLFLQACTSTSLNEEKLNNHQREPP